MVSELLARAVWKIQRCILILRKYLDEDRDELYFDDILPYMFAHLLCYWDDFQRISKGVTDEEFLHYKRTNERMYEAVVKDANSQFVVPGDLKLMFKNYKYIPSTIEEVSKMIEFMQKCAFEMETRLRKKRPDSSDHYSLLRLDLLRCASMSCCLKELGQVFVGNGDQIFLALKQKTEELKAEGFEVLKRNGFDLPEELLLRCNNEYHRALRRGRVSEKP